MKKRIWLTIIAGCVLVAGLPGRGLAQIVGPGNRSPRPTLPTKPASPRSPLNAEEPNSQAGNRMPADAFVTFDAPGAGTSAYHGTFAFGINPAGAITGDYVDASSLAHGFLRDRDGTITTFDAPDDVNGTYPTSINPEGVITGYYYDANLVSHGFVRDRNGTITTFDAPDDMYGTQPTSINPEGVITGYYVDANGVGHGFVRDRDSVVTTFDAPGAGTSAYQRTLALGINPSGTVSGCYTDANSVGHGFLRARNGTLTTYDLPASTQLGCPSFLLNPLGFGINPAGAITGAYFQPISGDPFGGNYRGFLRSPDGVFTTFDAATYSPCCIWTFGIAINPEGAIAGYYIDGFGINHGFVRARNGSMTTVDIPAGGTGVNQGTIADAINPAGTITGYYTDANNVAHGFVVK